ncbi:MAG: AMP-binding protein, partial [Bacteroidetes bacterium]|nr:AMP-binding protein [Bacteroidota bacterium]
LTFALFKIGAPVILIDPGMGYRNLLKCISGVKPRIFIGILRAHIFKKLNAKQFKTIEKSFCHGFSFGLFGTDLKKCTIDSKSKLSIYQPNEEDLAAIIFTTGSTGPPKGVRYEHSVFAAQLRLIRDYYKISSSDTDQPAFPLFALFSTALGASAVIPDMDSTKPARVDPAKFISSIQRNGVTYSFGSPALWNVVSRHCLENNITLNTLNLVLMAGAPIPGDLLERMVAILPSDTIIHTPYGATECLPIVSMEAKEILHKTWMLTKQGKGTCVGRALPDISIKIISITEDEIIDIDSIEELQQGEIGEIIVQGDVVTRAYDNNRTETKKSKIYDGKSLWHRMGDIGYLDESGRLWFCGRKGHRVITSKGVLFTIPCEAIVNNHPWVFRSALV